MKAPRVTEADFQAAVVQLAELLGWAAYHPRYSIASASGWPDLALCRPPRLILAEVKSDTGQLTPAQEEWGALLAACPGIEYYCWRPGDWDAIERALTGRDG